MINDIRTELTRRAIACINSYCDREYGAEIPFLADRLSSGHMVAIAYSTIDDSAGEEHAWQAHVDIRNRCITHIIDWKHEKEDRYGTLEGLVDALGELEWDWLYSDGCEFLEELENNNELPEVMTHADNA